MSNLTNYTDLTGRVAVVIGGTSGLGRVMAMGFAKAGADVVVTGRRENLVNEIAGEIEALGRRTIRKVADVMDRASLEALRDETVAKLGGVDILLNAAGKTKRRPTAELPVEEWRDIMETNVTGTLLSC